MDPNYNALNAAVNLEGLELEGGWKVGPLNGKDPSAIGGLFSVSYTVTRADGKHAFLKVIDLIRVFGDIDALQMAVNEYISERDLLLMCGERRLSRVVTAMAHGQLNVPGFLVGQVNYIIFELATNDVRVALSQSKTIDVVLKLEMLHDVAVGLQQLHRHRVAHQDLKPSNFLLFADDETRGAHGKIADLGRAYRDGHPSMHDSYTRPGDRGYAPPEQLYNYEYGDIDVRRFAADLYQLGNLAAFIFGGVTLNALLASELAPEHHWDQFGDGYEGALPYVTDAYGRALSRLRDEFPREVNESLVRIVEYLCVPDAPRRGHPAARRGHGSPFALQRVVSEIDLLARRTSVDLARTR
ncbi:protein kinase domain-containing protein [Cryobacterium aureum]|uniref:protein kinase domain-containing protein n=1 Tax=Cryobacterium aureum TaxID=995037 RepID=UPI001374E370|nr:lipopolysaccharide kinase InaA family protein [Cryobacterium aureum]